jgi:hypothetical protein
MSDRRDQDNIGLSQQLRRSLSPSQSLTGSDNQQQGHHECPQRTFYSVDVGEHFLQRVETCISQYEQQIKWLTRLLEQTMRLPEQSWLAQSPTPYYEPKSSQVYQLHIDDGEWEVSDAQDPLPAQT